MGNPVLLWLSTFSALTSLDGGVAKGYGDVPTVERSFVMQLCPVTPTSWTNKPALPSEACKQSSALTPSAFWACGEVASA